MNDLLETTVVWTNKDIAPHHLSRGDFFKNRLRALKSSFFKLFGAPGEDNYHTRTHRQEEIIFRQK